MSFEETNEVVMIHKDTPLIRIAVQYDATVTKDAEGQVHDGGKALIRVIPPEGHKPFGAKKILRRLIVLPYDKGSVPVEIYLMGSKFKRLLDAMPAVYQGISLELYKLWAAGQLELQKQEEINV
jgi:hypothetical protein